MAKIVEELSAVTGVTKAKSEGKTRFLERLVAKADKLFNDKEKGDDRWGQLSNNTQRWFNESIDALQNAKKDKTPVQFPPLGDEKVPEAAPDPKAARKAAAAKKAAAKKKAARQTNGGGRKANFDRDQTITILSKENPKRKGSAAEKLFNLYKNGMTVGQALDAGVRWRDINWDHSHELIRVG